jgi:hypothetical protein
MTLSKRLIGSSALFIIIAGQLSSGAPSVAFSVFDATFASSGFRQESALGAYREFVNREWPGEAYQHSLNLKALTLLMQAIDSVAQRRGPSSPQLAQSLDAVRPLIAMYDAGPADDIAQSAKLQKVFLALTDIVEGLVDASGLLKEPVDPRLSALRRSAESLDLSLPLRWQPDVIERFFHHAGKALHRISP